MKLVTHPNVVQLICFFYSKGDKVCPLNFFFFLKKIFSRPFLPSSHTKNPQKDEVYLNLVLEYVPETIYRASRHFARNRQTMPFILVKLYTYQLLRSLAHTHYLGICHRDIKPQNLLLDPTSGILKLCDFGR